jgi:hypothetical protein
MRQWASLNFSARRFGFAALHQAIDDDRVSGACAMWALDGPVDTLHVAQRVELETRGEAL